MLMKHAAAEKGAKTQNTESTKMPPTEWVGKNVEVMVPGQSRKRDQILASTDQTYKLFMNVEYKLLPSNVSIRQ